MRRIKSLIFFLVTFLLLISCENVALPGVKTDPALVGSWSRTSESIEPGIITRTFNEDGTGVETDLIEQNYIWSTSGTTLNIQFEGTRSGNEILSYEIEGSVLTETLPDGLYRTYDKILEEGKKTAEDGDDSTEDGKEIL